MTGTPTSASSSESQTRAVEVVLGSRSPARLRVLEAAGLAPRVLVSDVDEDAVLAGLVDEAPREVVLELARAKADAVVAALLAERAGVPATDEQADLLVVTCDSMLLVDGELRGKPHTREVAFTAWQTMRGRTAELLTGHCVTRMSPGQVSAPALATASTTIRFADVSDATIRAYVDTDEPLEVAGAFTLDGFGGWFVDGIDGDPSSVLGIGLPTMRTLCAQVGVDVTALWRH